MKFRKKLKARNNISAHSFTLNPYHSATAPRYLGLSQGHSKIT